VEFTDRPHQEVAAIIRHLMHVTAQARLRAPDADGRLFVAASVTQGYELRMAPWAPNKERSGFVDWLAAAGVAVDDAPTFAGCVNRQRWRRPSLLAGVSPTWPTITTKKCSGGITPKAPPCG
jgi:hypothetical protein